MKSTTRKIASGMLVLSLMQTTVASVPVNGIAQTESASLEVVQAVEADGVVNGHDRGTAPDMNVVVGGQPELDTSCKLCFGVAFAALLVVPPAGLGIGMGCVIACFGVF